MNRHFVFSALSLVVFLTARQEGRAQDVTLTPNGTESYRVSLPIILGWFDGQPAPYIQVEASDRTIAEQQNVNYAPMLANAANTGAVDDLYMVTNFPQGNVIASAPVPAGPKNVNKAYSPLWQVSMITWKSGVRPRLLTSQAAVLDAENSGAVTVVKTNVIVNCPVMYTPLGGLFPNAVLFPTK